MFLRIAAVIVFLFSTASYADNHRCALTGLQGATETLISSIAENRDEMREDREHLNRMVREIINPLFDFRRMSGLAMGKLWRKATDAEREKFEKEFSILIVRTYATSVMEYTNQDIVWKLRDPVNNKVKVTAKIKDQNGVVVDITFKLAKSKRYEGWRVYDVEIEGISIILTHRAAFADMARSVGVSGIINELEQKNNKLSK